MTGGTLVGILFTLVVTPVGIALAAKGGADIRYWVIVGHVTDRWTAALEILGGSVLLLLIAAFATFSPAATIVASLVWGVFPGILHILFPEDTFRLINDLPLIDNAMKVALHAWATNGFALISGFMLLGAGFVGVLRRK
ncbi:hypothetical protein NDR87_09715 [Nocardia sp. CDC159]|uniref:Uncharacterized protein n=1 Tax=Nocardia pulmonis TaxID=2951408 RepID=A0A9X2E6J6_9NOCA|nr:MULTISPECIES: hypothetical protein [Nocardia]MCM6773745.1 hypothetical protein [Nocardia pulmonis]MCM6786632.1 hypothetical protein [Nocardia sp. CDC159]